MDGFTMAVWCGRDGRTGLGRARCASTAFGRSSNSGQQMRGSDDLRVYPGHVRLSRYPPARGRRAAHSLLTKRTTPAGVHACMDGAPACGLHAARTPPRRQRPSASSPLAHHTTKCSRWCSKPRRGRQSKPRRGPLLASAGTLMVCCSTIAAISESLPLKSLCLRSSTTSIACSWWMARSQLSMRRSRSQTSW